MGNSFCENLQLVHHCIIETVSRTYSLGFAYRANMTVMLVILWVFALLRCALDDDDDDIMCISLFSYGRPVAVRCMGIRLGMGWVGSWVHKFTWQWVGLGR